MIENSSAISGVNEKPVTTSVMQDDGRENCSRKKILFIVSQPFFQWRGSPIRVAYDVTALAESGYEVDLLTLPHGEPANIPGVRIERVGNPLQIREIPIGPSPAKFFFDMLIALRGRRLIRRKRYDVIHGVEDCGIIAVWLARKSGARAVYEKHSDTGSYRARSLRNIVLRLYAGVERLTIMRADLVIGTGPRLAEQARRMGGAAPCRTIRDIPSSRVEADPEEAAARRRQWSADGEKILAAYVGSFAIYQGIDLLFKAIPIAVRMQPQLRFVIIGGNATQIARRRAQLAEAGCENTVIFTGPVSPDDLPSLLAASDILLSPRIAGENTPLKILDYLKAGRPIVATDLAANRQILNESNTVFVEPEPKNLAGGILCLANDADKRKQLGKAGRKLIREAYNYDLFKTALAGAYADLHAPGKQASRNAPK